LNWKTLESESHLETIIKESFLDNNGVAIFKHSTRCSISSVAKSRLVSSWDFDSEKLPLYYLDLISFRGISNLISEKFNIEHQSPQILVIKDGLCVYDASHMSISVRDLHSELKA
jgi:bacillithiol system protein YtxJ